MNDFTKRIALWAIVALLGVGLLNQFKTAATPQKQQQGNELDFYDFNKLARNGEIRGIEVKDAGKSVEISGTLDDGTQVFSIAPDTDNTFRKIDDNVGSYKFTPESEPAGPGLGSVLLGWAPMLLLIGVWIFFMRQMQGGGGMASKFGGNKARMLTQHHGRVTFNDVAGVDEAKEELQEIVEFLKNPQKFAQIGARIPKGALLVGPPGTGKTLIARAVAGEANVPFFTISGSDFVEMFVGVGASRVRTMFEEAKKHAPCIIFIDEIDAVGRHRGAGLGGGNDEREQTLNQLLVEMDGFEASQGVILIAATNRPDVLDPALLRPGRFDRQVVVPNPDVLGREKILQVHMKKVKVGPDVSAKIIARGTPGFSGADLANLVNEAALLAARAGKRIVTHADFEAAKDKVMMGAERRSMVMTQAEKELTAYHEAGHAITALRVAQADPLHKGTIIPRGRALGMVMQLPEGDRLSMNYTQMRSRLVILMGGRVAEEKRFGKEFITSGAQSDIQQATKLARAMITQWGFSDKLGKVALEGSEQEVFLGHAVTQKKGTSDETAKIVDAEIKRLIDEAYEEATSILTEHEAGWENIAQGLLKYETLTGEEMTRLANGEELVRPETAPEAAPEATTEAAGLRIPNTGGNGSGAAPAP